MVWPIGHDFLFWVGIDFLSLIMIPWADELSIQIHIAYLSLSQVHLPYMHQCHANAWSNNDYKHNRPALRIRWAIYAFSCSLVISYNKRSHYYLSCSSIEFSWFKTQNCMLNLLPTHKTLLVVFILSRVKLTPGQNPMWSC